MSEDVAFIGYGMVMSVLSVSNCFSIGEIVVETLEKKMGMRRSVKRSIRRYVIS